jgi:enoyl-CoA hydratase/carnithine racemase
MVTGRKFSYEEAKDMSLVHDIWDGSLEEFQQDVIDYAGQFTLPMAASKAIGNIKRSVQSGMEIPLEYHLALERELQSDLFQSSDAKEGIAAYVEKKTPRFKGE